MPWKKRSIQRISLYAAVVLFLGAMSGYTVCSLEIADIPVEPVDTAKYAYTYSAYLQNHGEAPYPAGNIQAEWETAAVTGESGAIRQYGDKSNAALLSGAGDRLTVDIEVAASGYYCLYLDYTGIVQTDKGLDLSLDIDGDIPFFEAEQLVLSRCYVNEESEKGIDSRGNQLIPKQKQILYWQEMAMHKSTNGSGDPYYFYFEVGTHQLGITALNGGIAISGIRVGHPKETVSYAEYCAMHTGTVAQAEDKILEGEATIRKSARTLYPTTDRTSCQTQPYDEGKTLLNTIGGENNWSKPGQWLEWDFHVEQIGRYRIALRAKQNQLNGMKCYRTISINGEIPFSEMENYGFQYDRSWYIETLQDAATGQPFEFYLEPGNYTLRMEAATGDMQAPLEKANQYLTEINALYRNIIMITSTSPDAYRDYNLEKAIPGLKDILTGLADQLDGLMENIKTVTGGSGTQAASILTLSRQLRDLAKKPHTIARRINNFYANISALSAWVLSASEQPLEIDYLRIGTEDSDELRANAPWYKTMISAAKSFFYSFLIDYDAIGDPAGGNRSITVWVSTGSEQAEALKQLINRSFTEQYGIDVSLKLVQGSLIEATLAGNGPDVALNVGMNQPVDFAARGILEPLENKEGFDKLVKERFYKSATIPYQYKKHTYALPETQEFDMMFIRRDVLDELQLKPPETWQELQTMITVLARSNMTAGISSISETTAGTVNLSFPKTLLTMLMQHDVDLYADDLRSTNLAMPKAVTAFEMLTDMYNKYGLPVYFDSSNRFRTGEMPIIIAPLSTYNFLSISAPEIAGRWEIMPIPGIRRDDGSINRTVEFAGIASILFSGSHIDVDACWEFLKWWTSDDVQYEYGMELETILGVSGRYMTANKNSFEKLPWSSRTAGAIREQWASASTVPQVPGYYFVSRYLTNALSDTILRKENAREAIERYADIIDAELKRKSDQLDAMWKE